MGKTELPKSWNYIKVELDSVNRINTTSKNKAMKLGSFLSQHVKMNRNDSVSLTTSLI